ncbi:MAG: PKD domain-containing protein [Anaerolineaceae bacterium]|nr:PKD domain-containing protein [Anaerolineaceae bacterium]
MARAATSGELALLRADRQWSELYLVFGKPGAVYSALVNQSSFDDPMHEITFDNGTGTLSDVKVGMLLYVGSSAGAWDKGIVRLRKSPSSTKFYFGMESDVSWANNDHLTVVREVGLRPRHPAEGSVLVMDADVAYSDQHDDFAPVPVLGPHVGLLLEGASVVHQRDASGSWVPGSTISSFAWFTDGPASVGISSTTAANPTFTFNTVGTYLIGCTVTAANGATTTSFRTTVVSDDPVVDFEIMTCSGDVDNGGWLFKVKLYDNAALSDVLPGGLVMVCAKDYYGDTQESIGPVSGFEHLVAVGWIDGESIDWGSEQGSVTFQCQGPHYWLEKMGAYPVNLEHSSGAPEGWQQIQNLTVDKALWHILTWRTTATMCMDVVNLTGSTDKSNLLSTAGENVWGQLNELARKVVGRPLCDALGRLFIEIDTQFVPSGSRNAPTVMAITDTDRVNVDIPRAPSQKRSAVNLGGLYFDGSTETVYLSKAAGAVLSLYGRPESVENLVLSSQSQANQLAGDILAERNNLYPFIDVEMAQNNRMVDIAPMQRLTISVASGDTPRGISLTDQKILPRRVERRWKGEYLMNYFECEGETSGQSGETVAYVPPAKRSNLASELPYDLTTGFELPAMKPLETAEFPEFEPIENPIEIDETEACAVDAPANGKYPVKIAGLLEANGVYEAVGKILAYVRTASHSNKTTYAIQGVWQKWTGTKWEDTTDDAFYNVYALAADGTILATGVHDGLTGSGKVRTGVLNATVVAKMRYLKISLDTSGALFRPSTVILTQDNGLSGTFVKTAGTLKSYPMGAGWRAEAYGYRWAFTPPGAPGAIPEVSLWLQFGAGAEFDGEDILIEQQTLWLQEDTGSALGNEMIGRWKTGINSTDLWTESYSPSVKGDIEMEVKESIITPGGLNDAVRVGTILKGDAAGYGSPNSNWLMNLYITAKRDATYRLYIEKVNLYNLCGGNA